MAPIKIITMLVMFSHVHLKLIFFLNGNAASPWIYTECNCMHWIHLFIIGTGGVGSALVCTLVNLRVSQNPGNFFTSLVLRAFQEELGPITSRKFSTDRIRPARTSSTDCPDTTVTQISKNSRRYFSHPINFQNYLLGPRTFWVWDSWSMARLLPKLGNLV